MNQLFHLAENGVDLRVTQHANGKIEISMTRGAGQPRTNEIVINLDPVKASDLGTRMSSAAFPFEPSARRGHVRERPILNGGSLPHMRDHGDECACVEHD